MSVGPESRALASGLEWDCFRVFAYFAYFKYPLTAFEVWKWLYMPEQAWTLAEVVEVLRNSSWLHKRMSGKNGFYALGEDVDAWLVDRQLRLHDALRKYGVLAPILRYLGRLPFVEGVFICNSLAWHHTTAESDIDLFIVAKPGRTWTVRLLAAGMMALLHKRPGEAKIDPVCCSFFVASDHLDLASLKLDEQDPYLAFWLATLIPMVDRQNTANRLREMNRWVDEVLPNAKSVVRAKRWLPKQYRAWLLPMLSELKAKEIQEQRFTSVIKEMQNKDTRVVVNNSMLKFHENDRRQKIIQALADTLCAF